jgi:undecaprenyl-diphosphatase
VYFGSSSITGVTGGIALGLAWVAIVGIAYRRHQGTPVIPGRLTLVVAITLVGATLWQLIHQGGEHLDRFSAPPTPMVIALNHWQQSGWQTLPVYRIDLQGQLEQPLTIQWAGRKKEIIDALLNRAWKNPVPLRFTTILRWLGSEPQLKTIPLLPQAHDGRHEAIVLTFMEPASNRELILRLWPSSIALTADTEPSDQQNIRKIPVWVGYVADFAIEHPLPWLGILRPQQDFDAPLKVFSAMLGDYNWRTAHRPDVSSGQAGKLSYDWHGDVLLINTMTN